MKFALLPLLLPASFLPLFASDGLPVTPGTTFFDNDQVKVMRALEKSHVKGKAHEHKANRVMIYLQPGVQRFEYQDGRKPEEFHWSAGQVVWSPANGVHAPEVTGDSSFNIVEVELKNSGTSAPVTGKLDPVKLDPKRYKVEFENPQVRVTRVKVGPQETTPIHEHGLNRVSVYLTDQNFQTVDQQGKTTSVTHKAGDVVWATPVVHKEQNVSDAPFEVVMVEIKN